jgi:hypothetical protein
VALKDDYKGVYGCPNTLGTVPLHLWRSFLLLLDPAGQRGSAFILKNGVSITRSIFVRKSIAQ